MQLTKEYLCTSNKETDRIFGTLYVEINIVIDAFINIYGAMLKRFICFTGNRRAYVYL
jgi:hypothetical protein